MPTAAGKEDQTKDSSGGDASAVEAARAVTKLIRVADAVERSLLDQAFAPFDMTGPQYNVLRILRGAGEPLPTMTLASRMLQQTPGVTGILDRLQSKGLVRRDRSTDDRRVWLCTITDEGRKLLEEMDHVVRQANRNAVRGVSDSELERLWDLLDRVERPHRRGDKI